MTRITRIKPIYTAIARPGAGKTEALLTKLPPLLHEGKRVILALPTLVLSNDITERASHMGIPVRTIDQRTEELVIPELKLALREKRESFIICTQEAIRRVPHSLLHGWMLVIDELPKVVDYPDYEIKPEELKRVFDYTEERNSQLWIKDGLKDLVEKQVSTNRADATGTDCSTLGRSAAHIFRLLLSDVSVFIDQPKANGARHVRAVEEFLDWWKIFSSAEEAHVLAANISGSEFEQFAQVHGFTFSNSVFTPGPGAYASTVTIYPLMPKGQNFSKRKMLTPCGSERLIDFVLRTTLKHVRSKPLLFANKWAGLQRMGGVQYVEKDCRGLNSYDTSTEAILLFGGNPSPADRKGLEYLNMRYGHDFEEAFITTRLLEPSLQAVTRTAIRRSDNTSHIRLFVQDERVAQYLVNTYLPDAKIDWSLSEQVPYKPDGRKKQHPQYQEAVRLLADGVAIKSIARICNVSPRAIRQWRDKAAA
ncbi:helix-turn-helix domain-containing protein [Ectopseudomonas mendocina]|uniref:helix-turn-helix domain-containing protein n=1 Tax=Ectopseudomonas mendocina TaxID=300 RepID=UPI000206DC64|nr:DEAD/DEAH box helicase [Pseudomonas mendocina]AEB58090.1 hypothetical protein MDS_2059 [Pseudomonas mendocina NK-01]